MSALCRRIRPVDIADALCALSEVRFVDTGGTNGWIANPDWLGAFVERLALGGTVMRALCRLLPAGQGIPPHVDAPMFRSNCERRFHVPLLTHPGVMMRWPDDGVEEHLEAGYLYEVRYDRLHEIVHRAPVDRVHIQINVVNATETRQ